MNGTLFFVANECDPNPTAAVFLGWLAPRGLDQNPPHGLGGSGEEMTAILCWRVSYREI